MNTEDLESERLEARIESRRYRAEARRCHAKSKRFLTKVDRYLAKGDTRNAEIATHWGEFYRLQAEANTLNADAKNNESKAHKHHAESKRLHAESDRLCNKATFLHAKANRLVVEANRSMFGSAKRLIAEAKHFHSTANRIMRQAVRTEEKGNKHVDDGNYLYAEAERLQAEAERYITEAQPHSDKANRLEDLGNWDYNADANRLYEEDNRYFAEAHPHSDNADSLEDLGDWLDQNANVNPLEAEDDRYFAEAQPHSGKADSLEDLGNWLDHNADVNRLEAVDDLYFTGPHFKETKTPNVPTHRTGRKQASKNTRRSRVSKGEYVKLVEKEQPENNQSSDVSEQASSMEDEKTKEKKCIPPFLKGEKKLVELLEYFEKNAILTSNWHKRNISQEEKKKIGEELTHINKEIRRYPSNSLFERRMKQRVIKEYGKALDDLNKSSALLQRRAELWMIKKKYKKALADLNDAKRKKEIAEKIEKTKITSESKQKELQQDEQNAKKENNADVAQGCGCLLVLVLIGTGILGHFFGTDESTVNRILAWLWEFPDWIKWFLILIFGIVGIFALQDIKRKNGRKKEANETIMIGTCLLILILAGFWLYFFGTGEPALEQIMSLLTWLWELLVWTTELPVWITLPLWFIIIPGFLVGFAKEEVKSGCAVTLIGLIGVGIWVLFF